MKTLLVVLPAALFVGCAGSAPAVDESAAGIELRIVQTAAPPVMTGVESIDVQYTFEVTNTAAAPITVRRITVTSAGGAAYQVERMSRPFDTVITPGATERIPFWARATGVSSLTGTNAPITLRAEVQLEGAEGRRTATFLRTITSELTVGSSRE